MGQATRTTLLLVDLAPRDQGGANPGKRQALEETIRQLEAARAFYIEFFLAHPAKLTEVVPVVSTRTGEVEQRLLSTDKLLAWAEVLTVETSDHPEPLSSWNFTHRFPDLPYLYRRSLIKDAIGKARGYLSHLATWQQSGKRKGKPGMPGAADHPTLYQGTFRLELEVGEVVHDRFVRLKVHTGEHWTWVPYPVKASRYFTQRLADPDWQVQSPTLVVRKRRVALHFPQVKAVLAKKVVERKRDPDLVTVAVDLNVKHLAVLTVRQRGHLKKVLVAKS